MHAGLESTEGGAAPSAGTHKTEASGAAAGQLQGAGSDGAPNGHSGQLQRPLPWLWWAARVLAVQQRVLSGPAASLQSGLSQLMPQASVCFWLTVISRATPAKWHDAPADKLHIRLPDLDPLLDTLDPSKTRLAVGTVLSIGAGPPQSLALLRFIYTSSLPMSAAQLLQQCGAWTAM